MVTHRFIVLTLGFDGAVVEIFTGWLIGTLRGSASLLTEGMSRRDCSVSLRRFTEPCSS